MYDTVPRSMAVDSSEFYLFFKKMELSTCIFA